MIRVEEIEKKKKAKNNLTNYFITIKYNIII